MLLNMAIKPHTADGRWWPDEHEHATGLTWLSSGLLKLAFLFRHRHSIFIFIFIIYNFIADSKSKRAEQINLEGKEGGWMVFG
jgi:hypothetical protein